MKGKGYEAFKTPFVALTDPKTRPLESRNTAGILTGVQHAPQEISMAEADMDCKETTNLVGIDMAVQAAWDEKYIAEHKQDLIQYDRQIADRVQSASRIIASGS